jgi:ribosomal protein S18 acetylase RimI-like enzyme
LKPIFLTRYDQNMAALPDPYSDPVVELRRITAEQIEPVLKEETAAWRTELDWDFSPSADLVRRFVHMQALSGFALIRGTEVLGYSYYVCEEGKGLIGDLYVRREFRTIDNENALLEAVLDAMWRSGGVRRAEAQFMMLSSPLRRSIPRQNWFRAYPRYFMEAPLGPVGTLPAKNIAGISIAPWSENRQDETARLIAASYLGHVDSQINDQYRSPVGARRFLMNIVQYPGCGSFYGPASFAASDADRKLRGISLASLVAPDVGHITQVCVSPPDRGTGLGYELMRQSLTALAVRGCRSVSLTVTASNETAIRLYQRMNFSVRRHFAAYVWEPSR